MYWLKSKNITTTHGFSTRHGGVSPKPYDSLNLGGTDDSPENILANRNRALADLDITHKQVAYLNQIHSNTVCQGIVEKQTGDALVTNKPNIALAVGAADCYPILFYDEINKVIGAAHCGWRGTIARICKNTIDEMCLLGAETKHIKIAIGQGISQENYEVSEDVISEFKNEGFPDNCFNNQLLSLIEANTFVLKESGIKAEHIWCMNRCTTEEDFFSYRRDQGKTGRMWGVIMMREKILSDLRDNK
jgi:polyphenol oxidase